MSKRADEALNRAKIFFFSSEIGKHVLAKGERVVFGGEPEGNRWIFTVYTSQREETEHGCEKDLEGPVPELLATVIVEEKNVFFRK